MEVRVEGVTFSYSEGTPVLDDVSLAVEPGRLLGLVGPNGSGKSTLLRLVSGTLRPSAGSVRLGSDDIRDLARREVARRLAMVEQDRPIGFEFSVREVVSMGRTPYLGRFGRETREDRRAVRDAMELADVAALQDRSIRAISGGERQRVFLAMALAQTPRVLLLDEPTTHLDLGHQVRFLAIVRERVEQGATVLVAIHDLTLAAQASDEIALIDRGRIQAMGDPGRVLTAKNVGSTFGVSIHTGRDPVTGDGFIVPRMELHDRK